LAAIPETHSGVRRSTPPGRQDRPFLSPRTMHELRTPINCILGFTALLDEQRGGPLNSDQLRYLGHIKSSSLTLLFRVNDLLDLGKLQAGD
jgi:signal transduction histidine kinase